MKSKENTFRGIARNVQWREKDGWTVLSFRIEQIDDEGNVGNYIPVELRETEIKGTLVDGDEIEALGKKDEEGILVPKQIVNLKTKARIAKHGSNKGIILLLLPFVCAIIFLIIYLLSAHRPNIGSAGGAAAFGAFVGGVLFFFSIVILMIIGAYKR